MRTLARHPAAAVAILSVLAAMILEYFCGIAKLVADLTNSGAFVGLFATLAGFLITGLTILLTLSDHSALRVVSGTRAFAYIHKAFIAAIWAQILALVMSVVVQAAYTSGSVHYVLQYIFVCTVFIAGGMLGSAVWFLSLVVNKVLHTKSKDWNSN